MNIFFDIFPPRKAALLTAKAELHKKILEHGYVLGEEKAVRILRFSKPKLQGMWLFHGKTANFSLEELVTIERKLRKARLLQDHEKRAEKVLDKESEA